MKIRTQSFVLMAGIALMPALVVSLSIVVEHISFAAREARRFEERVIMDDALGDEEMVRHFFSKKPAGVEMAIADPRGVVVYSDIPGIPSGSAFAESIIDSSRRLGPDRTLVFGLAPPMPRGFQAIVSVSRQELFPARFRDDFIRVGLLVLAAILAFSATMSILIVKSIAKSVLSLEAATKRVAAGELDRPIAVEGSNEIASLSRSLDILRVEIKEDQARRARFVMGISHDLKTPLALVKGYAEALEEELGEADPNARAHLGIIQSKAEQLESMIDDLIDFERVDSGEWRNGLVDLDLGKFIGAFAKRVEADATLLGREIRSAVELPPGSIVRMDERLATRALENLVNNSLRYSSPGDLISIDARVEGKEAYVLAVADEGPGISPEDLPHIFEPFYRGSSSRREQGMGLGLSIVKTIVESHGWAIAVRPGGLEGGPAKGVAFLVSIPAKGGSAEAPGGA